MGISTHVSSPNANCGIRARKARNMEATMAMTSRLLLFSYDARLDFALELTGKHDTDKEPLR
jgi:hypothetical protein